MSLVFASKAALLFAIYNSFLLMVGDQAETTADRFRAGSLVAFNPFVEFFATRRNAECNSRRCCWLEFMRSSKQKT